MSAPFAPNRADGRSQEVDEILIQRPNWPARYGTVVLAVVLVGLVGLVSLYSYPDTISGELVLTTVDPPRLLRAPQDFLIEEVLVADGDTVAATQTLIVARSQATFADVASLDTRLYNLRDESDRGLAEFEIPQAWNLGEIQEAAFDFQEKQTAYRNLLERRLDGLTTRELESRIAEKERFIRRERRGQNALEDQVRRARTQVQRSVQLAADGVDNETELTERRQSLSRAEDQLQSSRSKVRAASFDIELMRNQIESYRGGLPGTLSQAADDLRTGYEALRAAVSTWMRNYALAAPVRGTVVLDRNIRPERFILRGDDIATVLPATPGDLIGQVSLPVRGSGAVEVGQRVLVRFDSYPYLEYGSVEGTVLRRAPFERQNELTVEISFTEPLRSTTGHAITPTPFMRGEAVIIMGELSLLERFLERY